jgi:hypothetical protein
MTRTFTPRWARDPHVPGCYPACDNNNRYKYAIDVVCPALYRAHKISTSIVNPQL